MKAVTLEQYLGPYAASEEITPEVRANAEEFLPRLNAALVMYQQDGGEMPDNPHTSCVVAGEGNGGVRPPSCPIGAPSSQHKQGRACDIFDPLRAFARWCLRNVERLKAIGILGMENPRWTPTWTHLQDAAVHSGAFVFIPDASQPLAEALPEQLEGQA